MTYDSDKPCPDPDCPADSILEIEHEGRLVRVSCVCGIAGAWGETINEANQYWDCLRWAEQGGEG